MEAGADTSRSFGEFGPCPESPSEKDESSAGAAAAVPPPPPPPRGRSAAGLGCAVSSGRGGFCGAGAWEGVNLCATARGAAGGQALAVSSVTRQKAWMKKKKRLKGNFPAKGDREKLCGNAEERGYRCGLCSGKNIMRASSKSELEKLPTLEEMRRNFCASAK